VCIYDNASEDDTSAVVAEIARNDSRVKYHCHPKNIGGVPNFNYGMKQVTTPYFTLLSDDNTLLPHFFEDAINTLNCYPEAILFAGEAIVVNEKGQKIRESLHHWESGLTLPPDGLLNIVEKGIPTWESVLFKSEVLNSVGLLNPSFGGSADQDLMMRIARKYILYISKKQHAVILNHGDNWSDNYDLRDVLSTRRKMLEQWCHDEDLPDVMKKRIMKTFRPFVKKEIDDAIYRRWIIGDDCATITFANELRIKEIGLSLKPLIITLAAKIANYNRFLERFVLTCLHWYRQLKIK
jgi:glycosyltransferase involved in cell wall biosynthesis